MKSLKFELEQITSKQPHKTTQNSALLDTSCITAYTCLAQNSVKWNFKRQNLPSSTVSAT